MKTTLEIPDALFRKAKACAASRGKSLKSFVTEAIEVHLAGKQNSSDTKPWLKVFDKLNRNAEFHAETARIDAAIEKEFEGIEPEDMA